MRDQLFIILLNTLMYQEEFQRSLPLFHKLTVTIQPVSIFYQSSQGYQCNSFFAIFYNWKNISIRDTI